MISEIQAAFSLQHAFLRVIRFQVFDQCFPTKIAENAVKLFPFLDDTKLHSKRSVT